MRFTVADCLKLPALKEAKLVAGTGGLDKAVVSVSVLENARVSALSEGLMCSNELIITALITVKESVDEQLALIRRLCTAGMSGIVLYYLGIVLPRLDERLIQLADQLDFPIICMPENQYDLRYGEVIGEIYEAIVKNKLQSTNFLNLMLKNIAQLEEHRRTFDSVLQMLSKHLSCSLLLTDYTFTLLAQATEPMGAAGDLPEVLQHYREMPVAEPKEWKKFDLPDGAAVSTCCIQVVLDQDSWLNLIIICEPDHLCQASDLLQVADLLRLFTTIWKIDVGHVDMNLLIQAIIEDEPLTLKRRRLDVGEIGIMWIIRGDFDHLTPEQEQSCKSQILLCAGEFLKDRPKPVITGIYKGDVVILMAPYSYPELDAGLAEEFATALLAIDQSLSITAGYANGSNAIADLRESYLLFTNYYEAVRKIYPHRSVYTAQEIQFAKICQQLSTTEQAAVGGEPVTCLRELRAGDSLVETLTTFLLDNQSNVQKTAEQLFVHKSTIKYRLKKIQQHLGYPIFEMPASLNLYIALGVDRLFKQNK